MPRTFRPPHPATPSRRAVLGAAAGAVLLPAVGTATATAATRGGGGGGGTPRPYRRVWDDFSGGFDADGPAARWFHVQGGPYRADDGTVTARRGRLTVVPPGRHPVTGEPAFSQTIPARNPSGLPGSGDHAKWLAYTSHTASSGHPGFDAVPGQELLFQAEFTGRTHGTAGHPFGRAVRDAEDDLRLASPMLLTTDPETSVSFDFAVTNRRIYAWYGRPTFQRAALGDYASFAHTVPLRTRRPADRHVLTIGYDIAGGVVRWLIDGREALRVNRIGHRLDRSTATLDEGGREVLVRPRQLNAGMGLLTLLDGSWPTGRGLVRLSAPEHTTYYRPSVGAPVAERFVDERSADGSRLFGQGATMSVGTFTVASRPLR
ncbi:hypothetical protein SUDANB171_01641 [Streptomyces sp. enrichment culture]|uniref:DUF6081 family protein n=1 Tax=Streptomyces sp. enrichment culture TaxID=1795815 RepID=UPI003F54C873